jgi:hypothetical protein
MDWLSNAAFKRKIGVAERLATEHEEVKTTSSDVPSVDAKIVRSACRNAAVISLQMLDDLKNQRLLIVTTKPVSHLLDFRGQHVRECKNAAGGRSWAKRFVEGSFMMNLCDIADVLTDKATLEEAGFSLKPLPDCDADDPAVEAEDDLGAYLLPRSRGA